MAAVTFTAAAEEITDEGTSAVNPEDFLDWNKFVNNTYTSGVNGNLLPAYEYEKEEIAEPLYNYTFNFDKYFMSHNLYEILKLGENGGNSSFTYILDQGCKNQYIRIKKLENGSYVTVHNYEISSLYNGKSVYIEDIKCVIYAYDSVDGYICVNISIYDPENEPQFSAVYDVSTHRIRVSASFYKWNNDLINLALVRKDNNASIGYIDQMKSDNESVIFDFKFIYDPEDYIVVLNCEGKRYEYGLIDVVNSGQISEASLSITQDNSVVNASLQANDVFYSVNDSSFIIVAFYNADGNLISCEIAKCWQSNFNVKIPSGSAKAKTFAFESLENITPQTTSAEESLK